MAGNISFIVVGGLATILNLAEIILICKTRKNFKSYEQLLLSLSASDLVSGLAFLCLGILLPTITETPAQRLIGLIMPFLFSAENLLFIGLDRLIAVRFPLKHRIWVTQNKMKFTIILSWTVILLTLAGMFWIHETSPEMVQESFYLIPYSILFIVIVFTMIYAYIIYIVMTRKSPTNSHQKQHRRREKVLVTTCALIVAIFIACSCPIAFEILTKKDASHTTSIFLVVNSMLDPPVYFFKYYFDKKIKKEPKHTRGYQ